MKDPSEGYYYEGDWHQGLPHGPHGFAIYGDGSRYTGPFHLGERSGFGLCTYQPSGDHYEGQWLQDLWHGHGTLKYGKGLKIYQGGFEAGKRSGYGRLV